MDHSFYQVFDNTVDLLFLIDMIWMFLTSYTDNFGKEVFQSQKIAKKYLLSQRFVFDAGAILGTGVVTKMIPLLKIFGFFKMSRILRLGGVIRKMNIPDDLKAAMNMAKLTFYLYLMIHILGCGWYFVTFQNKDSFDESGRSLQWYPTFAWLNYTDTEYFDEDVSLTKKIIMSLYMAVLMIGCNELGPVNNEEFICSVRALIVCCIANAQIFG